MPITFQQGIQDKLDALTHKLLHQRIGAVPIHPEDFIARSGAVVTVISYQVAAAVGLTTSATFVDYPGPLDVTIVKKYDAATSKLVVFGTVGVYVSTGNARVDISLTIATVDHTIGTFFFNAAGTHALVPCQDDTFSGLGAGTLIGRVRWHSNGVIQVNTDTNDAVRLTVMEVML